jgi:hypothetical protein
MYKSQLMKRHARKMQLNKLSPYCGDLAIYSRSCGKQETTFCMVEITK